MSVRIESDGAPLVAVLTLVVWILVSTVAVVGFVVPYVRPQPLKKEAPPITAETLQVELTTETAPTLPSEPSRAAPPPEMTSVSDRIDEAPQLTPVAEPSVVAFALPVEGPVQLVTAKAAAHAAPAQVANSNAPLAAAAPAPQQLVYGEGEGKQPAPEYPYRARQEGQEGVVKVRFTVGENGRVLSADAATRCPWKMLNESAVRVVRERWRFRPGPVRVYEVSIRFQLTR